MDKRIHKIKKEIKDFFNRTFKKDLLFLIIYGSWAFGLNNKNSDVDIVAVCSKYNKKQLQKVIFFVIDLHKKYGLELDEEVPYEKKLLVTEKFVEKAILGNGFKKTKKKIIIQPVVKTKNFLSSDEIAMRLFLNAITTKNIFCAGNKKYFKRIREEALKNSVRIFYSAWNIEKASTDYFVDNLISRKGKSGQWYVGFDNLPPVRKYLKKTFEKVFKSLTHKEYLKKIKNEFFINNIRWFEKINQKKD